MYKSMEIKREYYLNQLIKKRQNGLVKVITGIRRCGKSYLLFKLYHNYLNSIGVEDKYIIELALDEIQNAKYCNPIELDNYIRSLIVEKDKQYYIFLDEIQRVGTIQNPYVEDKTCKISFVDTLLGLVKIKNVDLYVTGSNSKMLSSDILTEFKDRGDEIKIYPLNFKEFFSVYNGDVNSAWHEYYTYGGMPRILSETTHEEKSKYLKDLFKKTYITDVLERYKIKSDSENIEDLLNIISSSVGSLTNPNKLSSTFKSNKHTTISDKTIANYLDYFVDAFILNKAYRYDIKGKKYINTPLKYYFTDVGLRNARLNFRQQEENHIMENIIFNELLIRGFDVDIGVVEISIKDKLGKSQRVQLKVDFIANKGSNRYYLQSALNIDNEEKKEQEIRSLNKIGDSFKKIIIVKDPIIPWHDDNGILYIGIQQFLLDEEAIKL